MSDSQSPRAKRDSTNDPLEFCRGEVQTTANSPRRDGGPENALAWQHQGKGGDQKFDVDKSKS